MNYLEKVEGKIKQQLIESAGSDKKQKILTAIGDGIDQYQEERKLIGLGAFNVYALIELARMKAPKQDSDAMVAYVLEQVDGNFYKNKFSLAFLFHQLVDYFFGKLVDDKNYDIYMQVYDAKHTWRRDKKTKFYRHIRDAYREEKNVEKLNKLLEQMPEDSMKADLRRGVFNDGIPKSTQPVNSDAFPGRYKFPTRKNMPVSTSDTVTYTVGMTPKQFDRNLEMYVKLINKGDDKSIRRRNDLGDALLSYMQGNYTKLKVDGDEKRKIDGIIVAQTGGIDSDGLVDHLNDPTAYPLESMKGTFLGG